MPSLFHRAALPIAAAASLVALALGTADARSNDIAKSAPAFTKFMAKLIQDALPDAKVNIAGRLRLDVETQQGAHTTDLHNIYASCQRDPDDCQENVSVFVADSVYVYKTPDATPTRAALRIVVRPSAYLAAIFANSQLHKPIAAPLVGDYWLIAVIDRPTSIAVLEERDLPKLALTSKAALALAVENTREALQQSLEQELAKGACRGILGGDLYTASTVAFPDLWTVWTRRCHRPLLIAIPASDVVIYGDQTAPDSPRALAQVADGIMAQESKPFSDAIFRWSPKGWTLAMPASHGVPLKAPAPPSP